MTFLPCAAAPSGLLAYLRGMVPRPSFGSYGLSALEFLDLVPSLRAFLVRHWSMPGVGALSPA